MDVPIAGAATAAHPAVRICTRPRHCAVAHTPRYLYDSMPASLFKGKCAMKRSRNCEDPPLYCLSVC